MARLDGVPLYDVQALLGHESLATTQRYAHLAPDAHGRVIEWYSQRDDASLTHGAGRKGCAVKGNVYLTWVGLGGLEPPTSSSSVPGKCEAPGCERVTGGSHSAADGLTAGGVAVTSAVTPAGTAGLLMLAWPSGFWTDVSMVKAC
jgi:hypothetical protein